MCADTTSVRHEIIKIPEGGLAWIYIHSQNGFTYVAPHWHRDTEITYMLCGSARYCVNGKQQQLTEGELIIINDGAVHSCNMSTAQPSDAISIIFPYEFITQFQKKTGTIYFSLDFQNPSYDTLRDYFRQLYDKMLQKGHDPFYMLDVNRILFAIASVLFHDFISCGQPYAAYRTDRNQSRCQQITKYIDEHYPEAITLESMADYLGLSREHVSRTFKDYMGTTFKKYLTMIRMHHAYDDLIHTDLTLLNISLNNGFSDYRTFIRCFKEIYGITPLKYRKIKENTKDTFSLNNSKDLFLRKLGNEILNS